ncbi:MAG: TonB-dependent receptor, partial [Gammaproteobacteria bacterium]|nr:TonB-dependent receptor [Gammaproteobacteria bacterium]
MSFRNEQRMWLAAAIALCIFTLTPMAQEQGYLEEIMVTAQKREQNIQDIPVAVTALSGEQLVEYGITDMFDLQQSAPGLIFDQSQTATTANFSIRGIGTSSQNFGLEPSVGLYVDGVYRARQSSLINELADLERVEVLRGPQGTLFGRNTSSGAVLLNTVAPTHEPGGYFELNYGNFDLFSANGAFGGSLVEDVLAVRLTGFTANRDGFVDEADAGSSLLNDRDRYGGRAQLLYTPTEALSVRLILDYAEIDEVCCAAATLLNNFFSADGRPGSDALLASLGTPLLRGEQFNDRIVDLGRLPHSQNRDNGVSAQVDWDFGAATTLTSISAYRTFNTTDSSDVDFNAADLFTRHNRGESETFSQELRLTGSRGRVDYLAGAYYFNQNLNSRTETALGSDLEAFVVGGNPQLGAIINGMNLLSRLTGGALPMVAPAIPPGGSARDVMLQDHEAWALFSQMDVQLLEQWSLSAGLRYTDEQKRLRGTFTQDNFGPPPNLPAIGANLILVSQGLAAPDPAMLAPLAAPGWGFYLQPVFAPRPDVQETLKDDQITWNVKLNWTPNNDMLLYAGYATGFKSGGTNTDRIPAAFSQVFGAEKTRAVEAGVKLAMPQHNLRVNLALHYTTVKDFQSNAFTGAGFNLRNAGKLETKGGELEIAWAPTANLSLTGAYVYSDGEYDEFEQATCWLATPFQTGQADPGASPGVAFCNRSGADLPGSPEHTVLVSATQRHSFSDTVSGYLHADYNYRSSIIMDGNIDPLKVQDGFGLLNLRAGLVLEALDLDIALWARNVLQQDYHGIMFDVPLQDGKLASYLREPRTWGVTLRK